MHKVVTVTLLNFFYITIINAADSVESLQRLASYAILKNKDLAKDIFQDENIPVGIKYVLCERQNWLNETLVSASYFALQYAYEIVGLLNKGADPTYDHQKALHVIKQAPCGYGTHMFTAQEKKERISRIVQAFKQAGTAVDADAVVYTYLNS